MISIGGPYNNIGRRPYGMNESPTPWNPAEHYGSQGWGVTISRRHTGEGEYPTPWDKREHYGSNENHIISSSFNSPEYVRPGTVSGSYHDPYFFWGPGTLELPPSGPGQKLLFDDLQSSGVLR
jgi:hypothetical protein